MWRVRGARGGRAPEVELGKRQQDWVHVSRSSRPCARPCRCPAVSARLGVRRAQDVEDEERDADRDGRVGHVEVGPLVVPPVGVDEVDHVAEAGAVDQVADRAAEDEGESERGAGAQPRGRRTK